MEQERQSLKPVEGANRSLRKHLGLKGELALAFMPTLTVLLVLALVEALTQQRLLFASLASSAFLIYLDPQHGTNRVKTLVISQLSASFIGFLAFWFLGPGYFAAALAIVATILLMIILDVVHPPAVATSLSFAFRAGQENNLLLFALAVGMIAVLVGLERITLWMLARFTATGNKTR